MRQDRLGLVLQEAQCLVQRHVRWDHPLNCYGVELLEFLQIPRFGSGFQGGEGREAHQLTVGSSDVDLFELIRRQTFGALDLRNDLVAPALDAEAVDIVSAEQRGKVLTSLGQVHSLSTNLVTVEDNLSLWLIELQIGVGENEKATGECFLHQLIGEFTELPRFSRRHDHKLNRKISTTWQRGRR